MRGDYPFDAKTLLKTSPFLTAIRRFSKKNSPHRLFGDAVRPLTKKEIAALVRSGNYCETWANIFVHIGFRPDHVRNNTFFGVCVLGAFSGKTPMLKSTLKLPSGIYGSILVDSEIGDDCAVWNGRVTNYLIDGNTLIYNVGSLFCSSHASFGSGKALVIGNETGGREVFPFAEMTLSLATALVNRRYDTRLLTAYGTFIERYRARGAIGFGIVESDCCITNTNTIDGSYIGKNTTIDGATSVSNSTILGAAEEPVEISSGALIENSCIQWGCRVSSLAIVENSLLIEHSCVERHAKVAKSIIGPNTSIAEGEVTSCLVGPFVGFHHQALLIGALWPEGKGNIGYGANVGSNHTGKAPDQEIRCGEGVFFGLGINVKFPADFTNAPYTIIATGVTTLPQKLDFPFSLINTPSRVNPSLGPAFNELFPGWVLAENLYAIKRNEAKFKSRNLARRTELSFETFRPEIIDMIVSARNKLKNPSRKARLYLSKEIPGLGKNFLSEESRLEGIAVYDFFIEYYCLKGLLTYLSGHPKKKALSVSYSSVTKNAMWEHQRKLLVLEGFSKRTIRENLKRLKELERAIARSVQHSKEKDDARGEKIMSDYSSAHLPASRDYFIMETWAETHSTIRKIDLLLQQL
jgi:hypothetical protein